MPPSPTSAPISPPSPPLLPSKTFLSSTSDGGLAAHRGTGARFRRQSPPRQWGRDQLIAEIRGVSSKFGSLISLQWGRDQLIAEMVTLGHAFQSYRSFNGAAIN